MTTLCIILADIALLYFIFGHGLVRRLYPRKQKIRCRLREYEKHYTHILRRDRDLLSAKDCELLTELADEARRARKDANTDAADAVLTKHTERPLSIPGHKTSWMKENLEVLVVALGLAFGVRALFLQPFKIPTGSMQPTLYGIHFVADETVEPSPNPAKRFLDYLHYSRRYVDVTARAAGGFTAADIVPGHFEHALLPPAVERLVDWLLPTAILKIEGEDYRLPGDPDKVADYLGVRGAPGFRQVHSGDVLARGYLELGDHLFVDRTYLSFREPRRGDITVFTTDGIPGMSGKFYIKRLAGLPGDELMIHDRMLYIRPAGEAEFRRIGGEEEKAFERIYSNRGGYRGYCHLPRSRYLTEDGDTFTVPKNSYFMLGDNSENSSDSRFWGTVPRRNLVGRASLVWWPFSRRWGTADRVDPLPIESPPTR